MSFFEMETFMFLIFVPEFLLEKELDEWNVGNTIETFFLLNGCFPFLVRLRIEVDRTFYRKKFLITTLVSLSILVTAIRWMPLKIDNRVYSYLQTLHVFVDTVTLEKPSEYNNSIDLEPCLVLLTILGYLNTHEILAFVCSTLNKH